MAKSQQKKGKITIKKGKITKERAKNGRLFPKRPLKGASPLKNWRLSYTGVGLLSMSFLEMDQIIAVGKICPKFMCFFVCLCFNNIGLFQPGSVGAVQEYLSVKIVNNG